MKEQKAKALFLAGVTGNGERARQETQRVISGLAKITQPVFSSRLERFQRTPRNAHCVTSALRNRYRPALLVVREARRLATFATRWRHDCFGCAFLPFEVKR